MKKKPVRKIPRLCATCGKSFIPSQHQYLNCSMKCGHAYKYKNQGFKLLSVLERARKWYRTESGRRSVRNTYLKRRYGITLERYEEILSEQGGVCAICHEPPLSGRLLGVDHNHKTTAVRGLLCVKCNTTVGYVQDSIVIARAVLMYLERWSCAGIGGSFKADFGK